MCGRGGRSERKRNEKDRGSVLEERVEKHRPEIGGSDLILRVFPPELSARKRTNATEAHESELGDNGGPWIGRK